MASPAWSPDGQWIAFLGKEGKDAERYNTWNVYVMEARVGATPRQITHYDGVHASASRAQPEWSPDGKRLVYLESVRRKEQRLQHEPAGRGRGGRRRAEAAGRQAGPCGLVAAIHS